VFRGFLKKGTVCPGRKNCPHIGKGDDEEKTQEPRSVSKGEKEKEGHARFLQHAEERIIRKTDAGFTWAYSLRAEEIQ